MINHREYTGLNQSTNPTVAPKPELSAEERQTGRAACNHGCQVRGRTFVFLKPVISQLHTWELQNEVLNRLLLRPTTEVVNGESCLITG